MSAPMIIAGWFFLKGHVITSMQILLR